MKWTGENDYLEREIVDYHLHQGEMCELVGLCAIEGAKAILSNAIEMWLTGETMVQKHSSYFNGYCWRIEGLET